MVLLAMLCGGDYTEGIEGCGPVTALELLSEFPTNSIVAFDILSSFRDWWDQAQNVQKPPTDSKIREKLRKLKVKPGTESSKCFMVFIFYSRCDASVRE
jgi:DNA excision repair protein ERCC-5